MGCVISKKKNLTTDDDQQLKLNVEQPLVIPGSETKINDENIKLPAKLKKPDLVELPLVIPGIETEKNDENIKLPAQLKKPNLVEIKNVLHMLVSVNTHPIVGLNESAELLCNELGVSFIAITGISNDIHVLLSLHSTTRNLVNKQTINRGFPKWIQENIASYLEVPIGTSNTSSGSLIIGSDRRCMFEDDWWITMMNVITISLIPKVCSDLVQNICSLVSSTYNIENNVQFIQKVLGGIHNILLESTNIDMGVRIGMIRHNTNTVIIFEGKDIIEIDMENTLMNDAVNVSKARFVSDCASYLQSCLRPATDIFISQSRTVISIVVLPLVDCGKTVGGIYFTLEMSSNFQKIKDYLLGIMSTVGEMFVQKTHGQVETIWNEIKDSSSSSHLVPDKQNSESNSNSNSSDGTLTNESDSRFHNSRRNCTQAILKVLRNEINKINAMNHPREEWLEELFLTELIGKGGFGMVYRGMWKGSMAAVKVMCSCHHERQIMKDALEIAVLTTISHPNVVQVYMFLVDMVMEDVRFRRLQPDEDDNNIATCNVMVMEYCDRGNLRNAIRRGVFHRTLKNNDLAVDMYGIILILLEIAQSIRYLHSIKLLHCDIKPENILLKSDNTKSMGVITKLSDFGLAKMLRDSEYIVNRSGSGTVTHLAPELFQVGSHVTTAVDSYSFGIVMWEMYTGKRVYQRMAKDLIIDHVYKNNNRPEYPPGTPEQFQKLSVKCWQTDPNDRPDFIEITGSLQEMLQQYNRSDVSAEQPPAYSS
jgi:tRNA A-37 threonylcarbamoyl transferase component Bud32